MDNPILARLQNEQVLVAGDRQEWFQSCIRMLVGHKDGEKLTAAETMESAAADEGDGFWPAADDWRAAYRPYNVKNGVLRIPVQGVLLNKFGYTISFATGYTYILRAVQRGMADPEVKGIAFVCDSPGGEVSGCFELTDKITALRGTKPMRSFAADRAYSAAYAIACCADKISMTRTGGVGSIGVVTMHVDYSKMLAAAGIKVTFIQAGAFKTEGNPYQPLSAHAKARIQTRIDRIMDIFVGLVVQNRGLDEESVRATEADCYGSDEALDVGLADSVEVIEEGLIAFTDECNNDDPEEDDGEMAKTPEQVAAENQAATDAAVASAVAAATAEATAKATAAATTRINAILGCEEAKERPKAAFAVAMKSDMALDAARAMLADMPKESAQAAPAPGAGGAAAGKLFEAAMGNTDNPNVGAGNNGSGKAATDDELATTILADYGVVAGIEKKAA